MFFHKLTLGQINKIDKIQFRALRAALGYRASTTTNVILAEAKEPPLYLRFGFIYVTTI
ncbi:GSCOCG00012439001-RA-CDS [Cotesia congregata]|nr:GSCOCG00012439001-RA-CDS [Cotesia congregata]